MSLSFDPVSLIRFDTFEQRFLSNLLTKVVESYARTFPPAEIIQNDTTAFRNQRVERLQDQQDRIVPVTIAMQQRNSSWQWLFERLLKHALADGVLLTGTTEQPQNVYYVTLIRAAQTDSC